MKKRSKPASAAIGGLISALLLAAAFLPDLVGLGWHIVHGRDAEFRGWRIPVPTGWFAVRQGEGLAIERMLRFPLHNSTPTVVFLPMHTGRDATFDPNTWADVQIGIQERRGYRLAATREILMAGRTGYCWEFVRRKGSSLWWITCLVPSERLSADFSGQHAYTGAFYAILPAITYDRDAT